MPSLFYNKVIPDLALLQTQYFKSPHAPFYIMFLFPWIFYIIHTVLSYLIPIPNLLHIKIHTPMGTTHLKSMHIISHQHPLLILHKHTCSLFYSGLLNLPKLWGLKPIFHWKWGSRWVSNANETYTKNMKCTWPTPAFCVGTQRNLYSTGWRWGLASGKRQILALGNAKIYQHVGISNAKVFCVAVEYRLNTFQCKHMRHL